ncbi:MAG: hypothetical protein LBJ87_02200, partial [bacterium]|nr:hypothetical protein [bacterium]
CQFDFLYCLWTAARGTGSSGAYPASSAFDERRLLPLVGRFNEEQIRREVFPEVADTDLADAVKEVAELASNQSAQIGRWWRLPNGAAKFVSEHRSR